MDSLASSQRREELQTQLNRHLRQRMGSRLHDLEVEVHRDAVLLAGRAGSFHSLQVAIAAVQELVSQVQVEMRVDVGRQGDAGKGEKRPDADK